MVINFFREAGTYYFIQSEDPIDYYTTTLTGIRELTFKSNRLGYYFTPHDSSLGIIPVDFLTDRTAREWLKKIFPSATYHKMRKFHAAPRHGAKTTRIC